MPVLLFFARCRREHGGAICCCLFLLLRTLVLPVGAKAQQADEGKTHDLYRQVPVIHNESPSTSLIPDYGRFFGILATGGALAILAGEVENADTQENFLGHSPYEAPSDVGNVFGSGWVVGGGAAATWSVGAVTGQEEVANCGRDLARSYLASGVMAVIIKNAVNRRRPSGGGHSFPSGHTTSAFSTIPVLHYYLGWKGSLPATALAVCCGMGRMEDRHHYMSDVVFGAALGLAVGDAVIGQIKRDSLLGAVQFNGNGVSVSLDF